MNLHFFKAHSLLSPTNQMLMDSWVFMVKLFSVLQEESFYFVEGFDWFGMYFVDFELELYSFAFGLEYFEQHFECFGTAQYYFGQHSIPDRPVEYQPFDR